MNVVDQHPAVAELLDRPREEPFLWLSEIELLAEELALERELQSLRGVA